MCNSICSRHGTYKLIENNKVKCNSCLSIFTCGTNVNEDNKIFLQHSTSCAQLRDNVRLLCPEEETVDLCRIFISLFQNMLGNE